jgi:excisionase family DNA binding protein
LRVHELAKALGEPSSVVLQMLWDLGYYDYKSGASRLADEQLPTIHAALATVPPETWATARAQNAAEHAYREAWDDAQSMNLLTANEAAERVGVRPTTIHQWVSRGKLSPAVRDGRGNLFKLDDVELVERATRTAARRKHPTCGAEAAAAVPTVSNPPHAEITARDAATLCGVDPATIRKWVQRGTLTPGGVDERGRRLFRLVDVAKAESATRAAARR